MFRITNNWKFQKLCQSIPIDNLDTNALVRIYKIIYNEDISDISNPRFHEIHIYGVNYGTNDAGMTIEFNCKIEGRHQTSVVIPVEMYIFITYPFTLEYLIEFNGFRYEEIELLCNNDNVDDHAKAWLKLQ
jgi:hypothetical protein